MKFRVLLSLLALLCSAFDLFAVRAYFDYEVFLTPDQKPYVECITAFEGATFSLAPTASGKKAAKANLVLIISQGEKVIDFRKVTVDGPEVDDFASTDFLSLERFSLPYGEYTITVELSDANTALAPDVFSQKLVINSSNQIAAISDIQLISAYSPTQEPNAFSKSGFDLLPLVSNYFSSEMNNILFYAELYNTDSLFGAGNAFVSTLCIVDKYNNELAECKRIKREKAARVIPTLQSIDISTLPTGEYRIRLEIRDRTNQLVVAQEQIIVRNKVEQIAADRPAIPASLIATSWAADFTSADTLYEIIRSHIPISGAQDLNTIDFSLKEKNLQEMQSFLYSFWLERNPADPKGGFELYMLDVKACQDNFATKIKKGWETDRGRVYLQYGKPSTRIVRNHDPDYWPFEIWHYYETNNKLHDRRLLFINTTLNTDMELLHSDIPGEVQNADWKRLARSRGMSDVGTVGRNSNNQGTDPYSQDELEDLWYNPH